MEVERVPALEPRDRRCLEHLRPADVAEIVVFVRALDARRAARLPEHPEALVATRRVRDFAGVAQPILALLLGAAPGAVASLGERDFAEAARRLGLMHRELRARLGHVVGELAALGAEVGGACGAAEAVLLHVCRVVSSERLAVRSVGREGAQRHLALDRVAAPRLRAPHEPVVRRHHIHQHLVHHRHHLLRRKEELELGLRQRAQAVGALAARLLQRPTPHSSLAVSRSPVLELEAGDAGAVRTREQHRGGRIHLRGAPLALDRPVLVDCR
mmetsp:Transcript_13181/g.31987  ORF Transcript_13181/g.31987 Transcript_13181/m.31987 type:complete len:272 (+) Transcript_13181:886-1701(+)